MKLQKLCFFQIFLHVAENVSSIFLTTQMSIAISNEKKGSLKKISQKIGDLQFFTIYINSATIIFLRFRWTERQTVKIHFSLLHDAVFYKSFGFLMRFFGRNLKKHVFCENTFFCRKFLFKNRSILFLSDGKTFSRIF